MIYKTPFTLTDRERADIESLILVIGEILDSLSIMLHDDTSVEQMITFLHKMNLDSGICKYAERKDIRLNSTMVYYFKNRCVPYTAYWCGAPYDYKEIKIYDQKVYIYNCIKTRFDILNEALILSGK